MEEAAVAVAVVAEVAEAAVEAVGVAAAAGSLPVTTHPLWKGGKSHGAVHRYKEKSFMV